MIREYFGVRWRVHSPSLLTAEKDERLTVEYTQGYWYLYVDRVSSARQFLKREAALQWLAEMAEQRGVVL